MKDGADAALLVQLCLFCHQTVSLTARHLEDNGIPTVVVGFGKAIVEHSAVPHFIFVDFPLDNPCDNSYDLYMQMEIAKLAVSLLKSVEALQTAVRAPFESANADDWREVDDYVGPENEAELKDEGERRRVRLGKGPKRGL